MSDKLLFVATLQQAKLIGHQTDPVRNNKEEERDDYQFYENYCRGRLSYDLRCL